MEIFVVDAFTDVAFKGNSAAVCLVDRDLSDVDMQNIAAEMNHAETAFVQLIDETTSFTDVTKFSLCWFTPTVEVPLCGHATLASAKVILDQKANPASEIHFQTRQYGNISVVKISEEKKENKFVMKFPMNMPKPLKYFPPLSANFGKPEFVEVSPASPMITNFGKPKFIQAVLGQKASFLESIMYNQRAKKIVFAMKEPFSRRDLESLSPDLSSMLEMFPISEYKNHIISLIVTCSDFENKEYDILSRTFGPWSGIPEDPVTGASHTVLGPLWSKLLDKKHLKARQCSQRDGDLQLTVNWEEDMVHIAGHAVVTLCGQLLHFH